jgi:hypothetical protein
MSQDLTDAELRAMVRALSRVVGIPLSEERIEAVLPAYRELLENVEVFSALDVPVDVEPAVSFDLLRGRS